MEGELAETPLKLPAVEELVAKVRQEGVSRVRDTMMVGLSAVSAPVFDHDGRLLYVLTTLGQSDGFDTSLKGTTVNIVRNKARELSVRLGFKADPDKMKSKRRRPVNIKGLHHFAYRCRDAEETRHFYEDVLGLPLAHLIKLDHVPSTGEYCPYVHVFFQMGDGSYIAFFDLGDNVIADPSPNTPAWVNHLALEMETEEELLLLRNG